MINISNSGSNIISPTINFKFNIIYNISFSNFPTYRGSSVILLIASPISITFSLVSLIEPFKLFPFLMTRSNYSILASLKTFSAKTESLVNPLIYAGALTIDSDELTVQTSNGIDSSIHKPILLLLLAVKAALTKTSLLSVFNPLHQDDL